MGNYMYENVEIIGSFKHALTKRVMKDWALEIAFVMRYE